MNDLMIFNGNEVEVFELNGQILFNPYHVGRCLEQGVSVVKFIVDDLKVNIASRLLMYENYCKDVGIPTGFLPKIRT